jgi:hypothetical protein
MAVTGRLLLLLMSLPSPDELRQRSRLRDGFGRGNERVRDRDRHVARFHTGCHQRETKRVRAAVDCDRAFGVAERGKLFFEILHHGAADETRSADYLLKNRGQLRFELDMRRDQIKKRNILRMIH